MGKRESKKTRQSHDGMETGMADNDNDNNNNNNNDLENDNDDARHENAARSEDDDTTSVANEGDSEHDDDDVDVDVDVDVDEDDDDDDDDNPNPRKHSSSSSGTRTEGDGSINNHAGDNDQGCSSSDSSDDSGGNHGKNASHSHTKKSAADAKHSIQKTTPASSNKNLAEPAKKKQAPTTSNATKKKKSTSKAAKSSTASAENTAAATATISPNNTAEAPNTVASTAKATTTAKKKRSTAPGTAAALSKSYVDLVFEAIVALEDRTGSSVPAISKWILTAYPSLFGPHFKSRLNQGLKAGLNKKRFAKVKASFKISSEYKAQERARRQRQARAVAAAQRAKERAAVAAKAKATAAAAAANKAQQPTAKKDGGNVQGKENFRVETTSSPSASSSASSSKGSKNNARNSTSGKKQDPGLEQALARKAAAEKARRVEAAKRRAEAEAKARERAERLRRRRFPMEDTKLHAEDQELQVKPPPDVVPRPYMPYFWTMTMPLQDPVRTGKTSSTILQASKVDHLDTSSRGLVPDLLQVYHFFRGDVHFTSPDADPQNGGAVVPEFTLQHLVFAVEQVLNGNAKRSRVVPPLICHLFVTCLQLICQPPPLTGAETNQSGAVSTAVSNNSNNNGSNTMGGMAAASDFKQRAERQLRKDLSIYLLPALSPASWAYVCFLYMDAMERYYTTDVSLDHNVLQPLPIDLAYLLRWKDEPTAVPSSNNNDNDNETAPSSGNQHGGNSSVMESQTPLPDGYCGYLGDPRGTLTRAHDKLGKHDPWLLTAEELMALLRALTDDLLATQPAIMEDLAAREEQMQELLRNKRSAEAKFRKVRVAFEGPKRPPPKKPANSTAANGADGAAAGNDPTTATTTAASGEKATTIAGDFDDDGANESKNASVTTDGFKPTATKKQFETVKKTLDKATDAYEKGIRKLVARTEPIGYDRAFNAVYCFRHDPEVLYVEDLRPPLGKEESNVVLDLQFERRSWHVIETASLFDLFTSSLDVRGQREQQLYNELVGPQPGTAAMRRFLHNDVKEQAVINSKLKEKETLKKKIEVAKTKCDEEKGRRSGRLAGQAEIELSRLEHEMEVMDRELNGKQETPPRDYVELTGLAALRKFESCGRKETRRKKSTAAVKTTATLIVMPSSKLYSTGNIDGTGLVGLLAADLLALEERCETLVPSEKSDGSRSSWITRLENAVYAWNAMSPVVLGQSESQKNHSVIKNITTTTTANGEGADAMAGSKRSSLDPDDFLTKRRRTDSPSTNTNGWSQPSQSISSVVASLRNSLLDLEDRVADLSNVAVAIRDANLADDNMSTDSSDDDQIKKNKLERAWKLLVYRIKETQTKRHVRIRELVVSAIAAARSAHLPEVVSRLRAALLEYHPNAAFQCKVAAVKVLEDHGGFEPLEEDMEDDNKKDENEGANDGTLVPDDDVPSVLSADGVILTSSLDGSEESSRLDWVDAVKGSRTISRLASLTAAFVRKATEKLNKLEDERDQLFNALSTWEKENERRTKALANGKVVSRKGHEGPSEVWANVAYTDEICMVKVENYPWWPAKVCRAKDTYVADSLQRLHRKLVALVGEMGGLRVVKDEDIKPFNGTPVDDDDAAAAAPKDIRTQLDDCMAMARRIQRGRERQHTRPSNKK